MKIGCIYKIISKAKPSKFYVGSTQDFIGRKIGHLAAITKGKANRLIQAHCNTYGVADLSFEILERVWLPGELLAREQYFIDLLNPSLNVLPKAGSVLGLRYTDEQKMALSISRMGHIVSDETKAKLRLAHTGKKMSASARLNMCKGQKGRVKTAQEKEKISRANKGLKRSDETKAKIKAAKTGVVYSISARLKMSESQKRYHIQKNKLAS